MLEQPVVASKISSIIYQSQIANATVRNKVNDVRKLGEPQ